MRCPPPACDRVVGGSDRMQLIYAGTIVLTTCLQRETSAAARQHDLIPPRGKRGL